MVTWLLTSTGYIPVYCDKANTQPRFLLLNCANEHGCLLFAFQHIHSFHSQKEGWCQSQAVLASREDTALSGAFLHGLSDYTKDGLVATNLPVQLVLPLAATRPEMVI